MTSTLSPSDTGEIQRPRLSEDKTTDLTFAAHPPLFRRPDSTGEILMPRFLDDAPAQPIFPLARVLTGDDLVDDGPDAYVGRHRAPEGAEPIFADTPTWRWPSLIAVLLRRVGIR